MSSKSMMIDPMLGTADSKLVTTRRNDGMAEISRIARKIRRARKIERLSVAGSIGDGDDRQVEHAPWIAPEVHDGRRPS